MNSPLLIQTGLTVIAATIGSLVGAFLTLRLSRSKHLQELRSAAYVDFIRSLAKVAIARKDPLRNQATLRDEIEGVMLLADAKARIGIYGSSAVVEGLAKFIGEGAQTNTKEGMRALIVVCELMRKDSNSESVQFQDLSKLLFN